MEIIMLIFKQKSKKKKKKKKSVAQEIQWLNMGIKKKILWDSCEWQEHFTHHWNISALLLYLKVQESEAKQYEFGWNSLILGTVPDLVKSH